MIDRGHHLPITKQAEVLLNLQLHHVVADITGSTGLRIIRAILAGERDPDVLACLRHYSCHSSAETIAKALTGSYRTEHLFALEQALALYDAYYEKASACDVRIEAVLKELCIHRGRGIGSVAPARGVGTEPIRRTLWLSTSARRYSRFSERTSPRSTALVLTSP